MREQLSEESDRALFDKLGVEQLGILGKGEGEGVERGVEGGFRVDES
jgi:hypothetical protein